MTFAPLLDTPRLALRPLRLRDFPFYWQLVGHPEVRRYLGGAAPRRARLSRFLHLLVVGRGSGAWLVCARPRGQAIGLVELGPHKDGQDIELSYQFHPRAWGRGLACEATERVVTHGLLDVQLPRIIAETQAANAASCRLLERLGFAEDTRLTRFGNEQVIFTVPAPRTVEKSEIYIP
ncbi:GNAT family N-acetyltransferase [uncultured Tateyamaria sp.]|uniref:GNAT family N-acetyltransferase n=1 Tax=uncultured Tateyamaria sp. TaxID=455651 RepID=UPI002625CCBB|nr:GNAT family N-acetyltransferase [uncultured Tateyamaria sp.]